MLHAGQEPVPGLTLRRHLGAGAFGTVWEAIGRDNGRVALKFLSCRETQASVVHAEVRTLRSLQELQHPNIIALLGVYASSHYIILSMERADGNLEDLRQTYRELTGKNIPPDHLLEILEQAATTLDFLATVKLPGINPASAGLQHCDIKPSNLLLLGDTLKVADFGLCAGTSWKTHRAGWRGTPPYAAPELYHGQPTVGTDQYALAITYLKLCCGDRVFYPGDPGAGPPTMPVDLTKLRDQEVGVIARALHPKPLARYPSCRAFIDALRKAILAQRNSRPTPLQLLRLGLEPCHR
jgi:serine/threonine protein kinase